MTQSVYPYNDYNSPISRLSPFYQSFFWGLDRFNLYLKNITGDYASGVQEIIEHLKKQAIECNDGGSPISLDYSKSGPLSEENLKFFHVFQIIYELTCAELFSDSSLVNAFKAVLHDDKVPDAISKYSNLYRSNANDDHNAEAEKYDFTWGEARDLDEVRAHGVFYPLIKRKNGTLTAVYNEDLSSDAEQALRDFLKDNKRSRQDFRLVSAPSLNDVSVGATYFVAPRGALCMTPDDLMLSFGGVLDLVKDEGGADAFSKAAQERRNFLHSYMAAVEISDAGFAFKMEPVYLGVDGKPHVVSGEILARRNALLEMSSAARVFNHDNLG